MRRAGMLAMVLMCFVPSVANASPYEVWGCADAEGRPIAVDGWTPEGTVALSGTSNECAAGEGLFAGISSAVDLPANQSTLSWHFRAPADTRIASFRIWRWASPSRACAPISRSTDQLEFGPRFA